MSWLVPLHLLPEIMSTMQFFLTLRKGIDVDGNACILSDAQLRANDKFEVTEFGNSV